jgi:hypothetical protein
MINIALTNNMFTYRLNRGSKIKKEQNSMNIFMKDLKHNIGLSSTHLLVLS